MATQQTIAIIGALEEAAQSAIAGLTGTGYRLLLFCKEDDLSRLSAFAAGKRFDGTDVEWMSCPIEASWEADIILLSVPADEIAEVASAIREVAIGKPVVDIRNDEKDITKLKELLPYSVVAGRHKDSISTYIKSIS